MVVTVVTLRIVLTFKATTEAFVYGHTLYRVRFLCRV